MTDNFSDTAPETALGVSSDDLEEAAAPEREADIPGPLPAEDIPEGLPADSVEDGVALHIVEPHDPGTIMVAVAEPADMLYDQVPPCESEAFRAEQAAYADAAEEGGGRSIDPLPHYDDLTDVAAVRLGGLGPALFFLSRGVVCVSGDKVIVEMEEGHAFGEVASVMRVAPAHLEGGNGEGQTLRSLVRKATDKDIAAAENNRDVAAESLEYCRECIKERDLDMKLVDVLVLHDRSKMIFYFTAPARIDFRELVKDLVRRYRTRIELRQIGVRHETQMVGALGNCGMVCCCRRYLRKFAPVAIKMAKEQNVFLNPVKISGICGRLLCCLAYEQEHYDEFYRSCPKLGKKYHTDKGVMRVLRASLFRESVSVLTDAGEEVEYPLAEWNALNPFRPSAQQGGQVKKQDQSGQGQSQTQGQGQNQPLGQNQRKARPDRRERDGHAHRTGNGRPEAGRPGDSAADDGETVFVVEEETVVIVEDDDSLIVSVSHETTEIATREDDLDENDDVEEEGGSIFGLAPRKESAEADGFSRKKRAPRKRKPRSGQ